MTLEKILDIALPRLYLVTNTNVVVVLVQYFIFVKTE